MKEGDWKNKIEERLSDLLSEAGFSVKIRREEVISGVAERSDIRPDILARAASPAGKEEYELIVEMKSSGEPRVARMAIQQLREYLKNRPKAYGVFGAPYITGETGELCKKEGVGYLDAAGNCSLAFGSTLIQVKGNPNPFKEERKLKFLFSPKSSRVFRVMLSDPERSWFVRDLAEEAAVSLGQASNVKHRLLDYEFIKEEKKKFRLSDPGKLLQRWVENYSYSKSSAANFYSLQSPREFEIGFSDYCRSQNLSYAFTLFSGAARIAPFVRYNRVFSYVAEFPPDFQQRLRLKPVGTGANVTILRPYDAGVFYGLQEVNGEKVVCDVQLYLDLKSFGGRGEEAAEMILEKKIKPKW